MRIRVWLNAVLVLAFVVGAGACRKYITLPIYRRPVISSVDAFPTTLAPGDSTMITIHATDPDGDSLVYDWAAYNGLIIKGSPDEILNNTYSPSMIFYRPTTWPYPNDTAFVWCSVRDQRGGGDSRQVLIFYKD
jgi:hypothetical protein